jgi:AAA15 family ATPase/GTPase
MLIRDLTIKGYRCFEDFSMDGLTRVNLLVGNNNSGKTSFLEAIYLLVNQPSFRATSIGKAIKEIFENRGEFSQKIEKINNQSQQIVNKEYFLDRLFYGYGQDRVIKLDIFSKLDFSISTEIEEDELLSQIHLCYHDNKHMFSINKETGEVSEKFLTFNSQGTIHEDNFPLDKSDDIKNKKFINERVQSSLFFSNYQVNLDKILNIWNEIELTPKEDIVIEALRIILPTVDRIGFSISKGVNNIKLKIKGYKQPIPLSSMGYGMNRILTLAMTLVSTEKGVLLIDEIETGLHYEAQLDMWRLVLKTAQDLDVQVFATTHSWDCIAAFKEALQELEDQSVAKLFRLDSKYGKLRAVEYDAEEIRIAVNQGIEVR